MWGGGASPQKTFHSRAMWRHPLARTDLPTCTQIHLNSFGFIQTCSVPLKIAHSLSESLKRIWTHQISSSFTQSYSDSPSLAWIQSDSCCLTRIHRASLPLRLRPHSDSLRPPESCSDSLRLTQIVPGPFNLIFVHTRFRSVQMLSDSPSPGQIFSASPRFNLMSFRFL